MEMIIINKLNGCIILIEDDDLQEKYNTIWNKVNADIKKEFDSHLVYNKNYLKTKIKAHADEVIVFYDTKFLS